MTSLVSPDEVKVLVNTSVSDVNLQTVIDRVEADITDRIGAPQNDGLTVSVVKTLEGGGCELFFPTEVASIVSVVEYYGLPGETGTTLDTDEYQIWSGGVLERLPPEGVWARRCVVTYKPADDRPKRKQAIIDLVRIELERTAMKSESIAGEYSYTAPEDWEKEKRKIYKRLMFTVV